MSERIEEIGEYSEVADADSQEQVPEVGKLAEEPQAVQDDYDAAEEPTHQASDGLDHDEGMASPDGQAEAGTGAADDGLEHAQTDQEAPEVEPEEATSPKTASVHPETTDKAPQEEAAVQDYDLSQARAAFGAETSAKQDPGKEDSTDPNHAGFQAAADSDHVSSNSGAADSAPRTANQAKVSKPAKTEQANSTSPAQTGADHRTDTAADEVQGHEGAGKSDSAYTGVIEDEKKSSSYTGLTDDQDSRYEDWNHHTSYASVPKAPMIYAPVNPTTGSVGKPGATCRGQVRLGEHIRNGSFEPATAHYVWNSAAPNVTNSVLGAAEKRAVDAHPGKNKTKGGNGLRDCHC